MALRAGGATAGSETVQWLLGSQNADGGFGVARASASDSDMTGAALQALATVGRRDSQAAARAVDWLQRNQNDDGGFGQFRGRPSNSQSTAYAVQGLLAARDGGAAVSRARNYLGGLQRADGSVAYSSSSNQTPVWVTAQALMAFAGKPLPIATAPRKKRPRASAADRGGSGGAEAGGTSAGGKGGSSKADESGATPGGAGAITAEGSIADPTGAPPGAEPEGTTADALLEDTASTGAAARVEPVPVWAGILAGLGLLGLLWLLHRFVLPRRADLG
jgi:hypothetical protein